MDGYKRAYSLMSLDKKRKKDTLPLFSRSFCLTLLPSHPDKNQGQKKISSLLLTSSSLYFFQSLFFLELNDR
jgi:hypothetical protein